MIKMDILLCNLFFGIRPDQFQNSFSEQENEGPRMKFVGIITMFSTFPVSSGGQCFAGTQIVFGMENHNAIFQFSDCMLVIHNVRIVQRLQVV